MVYTDIAHVLNQPDPAHDVPLYLIGKLGFTNYFFNCQTLWFFAHLPAVHIDEYLFENGSRFSQ